MGRFARSWDLFKTSFSVIKQDKELLWLPILSFIASAIAFAGVAGLGFVAGVFPEPIDAEGNFRPLAALITFSLYLALAFVQVYFFAATVAGANERLAGGDPTLGSCFRKANQHLGQLFLWSLIVATVNVILQALRSLARDSRSPIGAIVGQIAVSLVGAAWNLATYFVVPILLFEDKHVGGGLKTSAGYFKKTWGEQIIGEAGIGFAGFVVSLLVIVAGLALTFGLATVAGTIGLAIGIALLVVGLIVSAIVFTVAGAVYRTGLYRFVSEGHAGGPFQDQQLAAAWRPVQ